jgi:hypothetical protein
MPKLFRLLLALLSLACAENALALEMEDLEVTIRVIGSGKEHAGHAAHKLELPNIPAQKQAHPNGKPRGSHGFTHAEKGTNKPGEKDEPLESHEHHGTHGDRMDRLGQTSEHHDRAVEHYENNKEERDDALEGRENLNEMFDNGDRQDFNSGGDSESTGGTDN